VELGQDSVQLLAVEYYYYSFSYGFGWESGK
jgi:hypothetical protein